MNRWDSQDAADIADAEDDARAADLDELDRAWERRELNIAHAMQEQEEWDG